MDGQHPINLLGDKETEAEGGNPENEIKNKKYTCQER